MGVTGFSEKRGHRGWLRASASPYVLAALAGVFLAPGAMAQTNSDTIETVVVSGIRDSLKSATDIKRNSVEVVDSIVAEDIGKLPDSNVAETMTRIPGVQGYRYGGEGASPVGVGSGLTVRGLSGQTASHVDGRAYFTAGQREFNIEGAIPGMIAGVDVYKNPGAEHIEGGIGGVINIRTRKPLDFGGEVIGAAVTGRYNDMVQKVKPEYFGLYSNRWGAGNYGEIGFLIAANYQESENRSDSNPSGAGAAIYTATANSDGTYSLASGSTSSSTAEATRLGQISFAGLSNNMYQENILRTRIGFQSAAQWRLSDKLDFYVEANYNRYLYHQQYRFLTANNTSTVKNLVTADTTEVTESLVNRNADGGADVLLAGKKVKSVTYVGDTFNSIGGVEYHPYTTQMLSGGANWHPTNDLDVRFDVSMVDAEVTDDNRSVTMKTAYGDTWNVGYDLSTSPHKISITGDSLADPNNWVFSSYANGTNYKTEDTGIASTIDVKYVPHWPIITMIKAGFRFSTQVEKYHNWGGNSGNLTTDGAALNATYSNAISVASSAYQGLVETSATNWMGHEAGYSGGFLTYAPEKLLDNMVRNKFSLAGITADDSLSEVVSNRRFSRENTYGGYVQAEYALFDGLIDGNFGVRLVQAENYARAMVAYSSGSGYYPNGQTGGEFNALPSANINFNITDDFKVKFGYGKGLMRAGIDALNPAITVSTSAGTGTMGNTGLRAETADSFDISIEKYFGNGAYAAIGLFDKELDGFFNSVSQCMTVSAYGSYTGSTDNGCTGGQWYVSQTVNAGKGYARGVELSGQTFFDFLPGMWSKFGAMASYAYVETENPVRFVTNGPFVNVAQPFQSKHSASASLLYEDDNLSGRLVYTYRSSFVLFGVSQYPQNGRVVEGYGLLDASVNYELGYNMTLSATVSNITNAAPNRYIGEPGYTNSSFERQHYMNGRIYSIGVRFRTGQ